MCILAEAVTVFSFVPTADESGLSELEKQALGAQIVAATWRVALFPITISLKASLVALKRTHSFRLE